MRADMHPQQLRRLSALRNLNILDTPRERPFDEITELAAAICDAPISVINLIDEHRQWFKAEIGLGVRETPIDTSICAHVILQEGLTVIPDTLRDMRLRDNPLCTGEPHLRFYAGALLESSEGLPLGTLCVLDHRPRDLTGVQKMTLSVLARQVMAQIHLRNELERTSFLLKEVDHRVKNSLTLVGSMLTMQGQASQNEPVRQALAKARDRVMAVASLHDQLHDSGSADAVYLGQFFKKMVAALKSQAPDSTVFELDIDDASLPARVAVNVGIVINELVTNALQHAFLDGQAGHILVRSANVEDGVQFSVHDDGRGLPDGFDPARARGMGMKVASALAKHLGSGLQWTSAPRATMFRFLVDTNGRAAAG